MTSFPVPIEQLLPQRPPMLLLDRLRRAPDRGVAEALVAPGNLFRLPDETLHAAALFELMAQAYAAVRGVPNTVAGKPVRRAIWSVTRAGRERRRRVGDRLSSRVTDHRRRREPRPGRGTREPRSARRSPRGACAVVIPPRRAARKEPR